MELETIPFDLTVCKIRELRADDLKSDFFFIGKTDEELSLVCKTADTPPDAITADSGWRAFRFVGILDFSLVGILAPVAALLAENRIGIFAVSTYNTDYILVKRENFGKALALLRENGYTIVNNENTEVSDRDL